MENLKGLKDFAVTVDMLEKELTKQKYLSSFVLFLITEHLNTNGNELMWGEVCNIIRNFEKKYQVKFEEF